MSARTFLLPALLLGFLACATDAEPGPETSETFGAAFSTDEVQSAESLWSSYSEDELSDSLRLTISGTVEEVCQAKGCWMTIAGEDGKEMKVTFKDYGFFVPKDLSGKAVVMHGVAYVQDTPVAELRHFAEDAGATEAEIAAIDRPRREFRFVADGVRLLD